ncbi:UNVERIFIED_CONTAM: hypothetical protein Sradi_4389100 [Sesamum radiatum]|uniref:Retrotransposon Copia-like N-terminal domain-containing protein n=1 Tax=Sesamum radiatum TaxID=300843 RepID=A0AAW2NRV6_SESRA
MRIALEGCDRLGFINATCAKPDEGSAELKQWRITNSMVRTWILNTISKDIVNAYLYAASMRSLWLELEARAKTNEIDTDQLIQFLTGLNESYDHIRNQIHVLDLLPSVNKAYSMILRPERQRQVNLGMIDAGDTLALLGKIYDNRTSSGPKNTLRRKCPFDKRHLNCDHCHEHDTPKRITSNYMGRLTGIKISVTYGGQMGMGKEHM